MHFCLQMSQDLKVSFIAAETQAMMNLIVLVAHTFDGAYLLYILVRLNHPNYFEWHSQLGDDIVGTS